MLESLEANYPGAWGDYRRRRKLMFVSFALFLPVVFLIGMPLSALLKRDVVGVVGVMMVVYCWVAMFRFVKWRCPRCGKRFHLRGLVGKSFSTECIHCGLPERF